MDLHECDASDHIFCALLLGDPYRQGFVPTRKKVPSNSLFREKQHCGAFGFWSASIFGEYLIRATRRRGGGGERRVLDYSGNTSPERVSGDYLG